MVSFLVSNSSHQTSVEENRWLLGGAMVELVKPVNPVEDGALFQRGNSLTNQFAPLSCSMRLYLQQCSSITAS